MKNEAVEAFSKISMPISKYATNSKTINDNFLKSGLIEKIPETVKLLGMEINIANDLFLINLPDFKLTTPSMKEVVSEFSSIWDVPGVLGPVHVCAKLLISNLHKKKYKCRGGSRMSCWGVRETNLRPFNYLR